MEEYEIKNRIRGSLIGGAVGDALGYPVEFKTYQRIVSLYGPTGITRYSLSSEGKALVSDDTQMTLYTACGLINANKIGQNPVVTTTRAYIEWLCTQDSSTKWPLQECWITDLEELHSLRAPGNTCISTLKAIVIGKEVINNSKGCGGVMRIAPVALYGASRPTLCLTSLNTLAAELSQITHKHPLSSISSAFISHLIYCLATDEEPTEDSLRGYVGDALRAVSGMFLDDERNMEYFAQLIHRAIVLTQNEDMAEVEAINLLGEGWVAEESAAIALYCALRHADSFESAVVAAVNHCGDSDSTGAITGNIMGAMVGYDAIPQYFKDNLELHDVILKVADQLYEC